MKIIKILPLIFGLALILTSCTKDYIEINENPNSIDKAPVESVLAYNIIEISDRFEIANEMEYTASYIGHISMSQNNEIQNYITGAPTDIWFAYYVRSLTNLNQIMNDATDDEVNFKAAAMVLKAYVTQMNVDAYGPMPYFDAAQKAEGKNQPKFDSEKDIYYDMLEQLELANSLFAAEARELGAADVIYGGNDLVAWQKFTNSLRLRVAIRMSNVDEAKAKSEISAILSNPTDYPIFESNSDNAILKFPGDDWKDPWTRTSQYKPYIKIAAPLVDTLKELSDPRLEQYALVNNSGEYVGLQVGANGGTESKVHPQFILNPDDGKIYFLTYSEVEFIKAEAYARGFVSGDADAAYQNAIRANMESFGIGNDEINTYLSQNEVAYNGNVNKIYIQKWISLFRQSWEAWAEMRRTDIPKLPLAMQSNYDGHNRVPFRFAYPQSEKDLNGDQIPTNVTENDIYWGYQIWWDTRTDVQ